MKKRDPRWIGVLALALVFCGCDSPAQGEEPGARLVNIEVPYSPEAARSLGCMLPGHHVGSSLGSLLVLSGGLERFYQVDDYGEVKVVVLGETEGFSTGGPEGFSLWVVEGGQNQDKEFVRPEDKRAEGTLFLGVVLDEDGWFRVEASSLTVPIPILDDWVIYPTLSAAALEAKFIVEEPGFKTERMLLTGYLSSESLLSLVEKVIEVCGRPEEERPNLCPVIGNQIRGDTPSEEAFPIFVSFMGGFDSRMDDGVLGECKASSEESGSACNAISVCMELDFQAARLVD